MAGQERALLHMSNCAMYTNKLLTVKEADGLQNEIKALSCKRRLHLDGHMHMSGGREGAVSEI